MVTKSFTSLRRLSGHALTMMLFCASISKAQVTPVVAPSYAQALTPPSGLGTVFQTVVDSFGDLLVNDYANGALYEYPAGGGAVITLLPPGSLGGYNNPGIAIDSTNAIYLGGNWNNTLGRLPYDPATKSWDGLDTISAASGNASTNFCPKGSGTPAAPYGFACGDTPNTSPYYFQPWAITTDSSGNLIVTSQNGGNFIFEIPVTYSGSTATPQPANSLILAGSSARAQSVAIDKFGNVYFVEETDQKAPLPGVLMLPAGSTGVASDAGLTRVDPNLPAVTGVTTDASGNLYVSDSKQGVYLIPNPSGTPQTSSAVLLTPVPASGQVSIDWVRGIMYVPSNQNGQQIYAVTFNNAALGTVAAGASSSTAAPILFGFNGNATPNSIVVQEAGAKTPDFTIASGGTCKTGTAYVAGGNCSVNVTLNPHAAGSVAAKLLMLDGTGNLLASMPLSGVGSGSAIQLSPGVQSTIGGGLMTPSQVAVDAAGNVYVADPGFSTVQAYAKGSNTATNVGTGLTSPTGVAVNGAGDVFIADGGSGTVVEVPNGPSGLIASAQVMLRSGLGTSLNLATDTNNNLYVSDPVNGRVVKLGNIGVTISAFSQSETDITGFITPSALAVDSTNNLYVADGSNLIEVAPGGTPTTLLSSLGSVNGLAVDPSGSVYVAQSGGTIRIPNESGTLNPADQTTFATQVTAPASVAIDAAQNVYVADATAKDVLLVSANASVNFGTLSSPTATASASYTVLNDGNAALNISGFSGTADYSGSSSNCSSAISVGSNCSLTVTFSAGPGDQGTLSGQVVVQSNAANSPIAVSATGVGAPLAPSTTKITVNNPTVNGAPTVITVTPATGTTPTPTGKVTLTVTGNGITPITLTGTLSSGSATLTPTQLPVATYQFSVTYQGDRAFAGSGATQSVKIGAGAVTMTQPTLAQVQKNNPAYPLVLGNAAGSQEPYDGSAQQFISISYYTVKVIPANGQSLIGQTVYDSTGKVTGMNYGTVSFQGASSTCQTLPVQSDGTAQFDPSCLTIDTSNSSIPNIMSSYTVTPAYSPTGTYNNISYTNPNYTAFTGTALNYTSLRNPLVQIAASPTALTVTKGSSATATLSLSSVLGFGVAGSNGLLNNYSLPVQLQCDGLPAYATCTFVYPNPDPSDVNSVHVGPATGSVLSIRGGTAAPCTVAQGCSGPGTVMMTITTNVPSGIAMLKERPTGSVFLAMLGLGMLSLCFGRKRSLRSRFGTLAILALCCGILAGASGCSTTQLGGNTPQVSPSGSYTVVVTAKQVGSQVITSNPYIVYGNGNQMSLPFTIQLTVQ